MIQLFAGEVNFPSYDVIIKARIDDYKKLIPVSRNMKERLFRISELKRLEIIYQTILN
jgi:hypothetical protein